MKVSLRVEYQGVDISRDISNNLLSFTWNDNESGKLDDIDLTLEDAGDVWISNWMPGQNDTIKAWITCNDVTVFCGTFSVDEVSFSGPPNTISIKAASLPTDKALKKTSRTKAWEDVTLREIASKIAESSSMALVFDAEDNIRFSRKDQLRETDLAFLNRICGEAGLALKITDGQIAIYSLEKYDSKDAVLTIDRHVLQWSFDVESFTTTGSVIINYYNPEKFRLDSFKFGRGSPVTSATRFVVSKADAERQAKALMRTKNSRAVKGKLTVVGNPALIAGVNVNLTGYGKLDGRYAVERVTHSIFPGYTTSIDVRATLEGY